MSVRKGLRGERSKARVQDNRRSQPCTLQAKQGKTQVFAPRNRIVEKVAAPFPLSTPTIPFSSSVHTSMLRPSPRLLKAAPAAAQATTALPRGAVIAPSAAGSSAHRIVLLVRDDLKMDRGKVAVQCSHAALLLYTLPSSSSTAFSSHPLSRDVARWRSAWQAEGHPTLPLRVPDLDSMHALAHEAQQRGLPTAIVRDAGRTQVRSGSETVLGIGPAEGRVIDEICGESRGEEERRRVRAGLMRLLPLAGHLDPL